MDISTAKYTELKTLRDNIDIRLREIETLTVKDIEEMANSFGFSFLGAEVEPKQRRKRRTKLEMAAAGGTMNGTVLSQERAHGSNGSLEGEADQGA